MLRRIPGALHREARPTGDGHKRSNVFEFQRRDANVMEVSRAHVEGGMMQDRPDFPTMKQPAEVDGRRNLANSPRVQRFLGVSRSTLMRYIADRKIDAIKMDGGW